MILRVWLKLVMGKEKIERTKKKGVRPRHTKKKNNTFDIFSLR